MDLLVHLMAILIFGSLYIITAKSSAAKSAAVTPPRHVIHVGATNFENTYSDIDLLQRIMSQLSRSTSPPHYITSHAQNSSWGDFLVIYACF